MSVRRSLPVSLHCVNYAASVVSSRRSQSLNVAALVLSRLDYGKGTLVGLPAYLIRRLQSVQNAATRLIFRLRRCDHITDALVSLHWLQVPQRIVFKVAVQTYRALRGDAPQYMQQLTRTAEWRRHPFSAQTPVLSHRRSVRSCCQAFDCRSPAFSVAGARYVERFTVGSLPPHRRCLQYFKQRLKCIRYLYPGHSFPHLLCGTCSRCLLLRPRKNVID